MIEDKKILTALRKAQSHLGNVIRMVDEGEYCVDILQQNLAVIGLLRSANDKLFGRHLNNCFASAMKGTNEEIKKRMIDEVLQLNKISR